MTEDENRLIRESWAHVMPIADTAASLFYDHLFTIDPSVRPLFANADMAAQRGKLVQALDLVVTSLDDLDGILEALRDLGRRHVDYGVTATHYGSVGAAFLWTLEAGLGDAWTEETGAAWARAYGLIAEVMQETEAAAV